MLRLNCHFSAAENLIDELAQIAKFCSAETLGGFDTLRHPGCFEAELGSFLETQTGMRDRTDFARERDFSEYHRFARHRPLGHCRDQRCSNRKVRPGVAEAIAAGDVEIDFRSREAE